MRSLPDTSTHNQQWELSPRPFDRESNQSASCSHIVTQAASFSVILDVPSRWENTLQLGAEKLYIGNLQWLLIS